MKEKLCAFAAGMKRPRMERRIPALLIAVSLMGFGVAMFNLLGFGADPCTVMNMGLSTNLGIPFGTLQLLVNCLLILIVIRYDPGRIGLGTLANMVLVGYVAQFCMAVIDRIPALSALTLTARLIIFVPTLLMFLVAASTYMCVDMGVAPYDAIPQIIAARMNWPFRLVRMAWDFVMMLGGYLLGSVVGLVTIGITLFLGPLVAWMAGYVKRFFD
ncbi:MAG: YitT family protein [Candidatus Ventricola sp.]